MTGTPDGKALPGDEHRRFHRYLQALSTASGADEAELVGTILLDPDSAMAQSAVLRHLDGQAPRLLEPPAERFDNWAGGLAAVVDPFPYLR